MNSDDLLKQMQMMLTQDTQSFFEHLGGLHGSEVLSIFLMNKKKNV